MSVIPPLAARLKSQLAYALSQHPRLYRSAQGLYRRFTLHRTLPLQVEILQGLRGLREVYFVQVGSNDGGAQNDPLHQLIVRNPDWRGIFIEPVPFLFERLRANYAGNTRFAFENVAIAASAGLAPFYYVSEQAKQALGERLPYWYDQLGSFDRNHIVKHLEGLLEPFIVEVQLPCLPITAVLERNGASHVDLLHIDTEGYDYEVLKQFDFPRYKPRVVLYEHKHLGSEHLLAARELLVKQGYSLHARTADTLALRLSR
ncbi:MAG: FkbM family methyltransferase [Pseudomonadota bacterium]